MDLPADLDHRRAHLFGGRRDGADIGGGFLGGRCHHSGELLGFFRGARQGAGGGFELLGSGRHRIDDAADRGFERAGEPDHLVLALRSRSGFLLLLLGLHLLDADQIFLEGLGRAGVVAHFVAPGRIGDLDGLVAARELQEHIADTPDRAGDAPHRKHRGTDEHQHDEDADDDREVGDAIELDQQFTPCVVPRIRWRHPRDRRCVYRLPSLPGAYALRECPPSPFQPRTWLRRRGR